MNKLRTVFTVLSEVEYVNILLQKGFKLLSKNSFFTVLANTEKTVVISGVGSATAVYLAMSLETTSQYNPWLPRINSIDVRSVTGKRDQYVVAELEPLVKCSKVEVEKVSTVLNDPELILTLQKSGIVNIDSNILEVCELLVDTECQVDISLGCVMKRGTQLVIISP